MTAYKVFAETVGSPEWFALAGVIGLGGATEHT
jgi:hypothetical protein